MRPDFTNLRNRTKITFMATIDSYRSPFPHEELLERARRIRHVALDMDGTIYMGMSLFPYTKRFLSDLTEMGIGYSFLTNNPSKSIADYLHKLDTLGIHATRDEMYTTALATIDYIREHYPAAKRLFLLGTPSMISEFEAAGFESAADGADDVPDVVVAAFDMTLTYPRLCRAAWWVSQGVPTSPPIPTGYALPTSPPCWSTAARSAPASNTPRDAAPTSRWANPIRTCSPASRSVSACAPMRSPWWATASILT